MSFFVRFYQILFHPWTTFKGLAEDTAHGDPLLLQAILTVLGTSIFVALSSSLNASWFTLPFIILLQAVVGLSTWFFTASVFSSTSQLFGQQGRFWTFLILSAFSFTPWVFIPITTLLKLTGNPVEYFLGEIGFMALWLWSTLLFGMALKAAYQLSLGKLFLSLSLPFLMMIVAFNWLGSFISNILKLFY